MPPPEPPAGRVRRTARLQVSPAPWADVRLLQVSVTALLILDLTLQHVGGVLELTSVGIWVALVLVSMSTLLVLLSPRSVEQPSGIARASVLALLCTVDLVAIGLARLAPYDGGIALVAVLPAVWLGAVLGRAGAVLGALASAAFITVPGLLYGGLQGEFLASSVPVPGVVLVVGIAVSEGVRRATEAQTAAEQHLVDLQAALDTLCFESQRTQAIIDTSGVGLMLIEPDGSLAYANPPAAAAIQALFPDADHDEPTSPGRLTARIARGEEFNDVRVWIGPANARRLLLVSGRQLARDGSARGGVIAFSDITEKERSLRLRTNFTNAVAHELRTPLMSLEGHLSLLRDIADLPDEAQALLPALDRSSARLRRLGAQLVHDSGQNNRSVHASRQLACLSELVELVCADFACRARPKGAATIEVRLGQRVDTRIDTVLITEMLQELLANACRHAPRQTPVTVALSISPDDGIELLVSDLGPGIDSSRHLSIFEPTREMLGDHGQLSGLPFCKAVVTAHEGHLDIDSRLGSGTTFLVHLPLDEGRESIRRGRQPGA